MKYVLILIALMSITLLKACGFSDAKGQSPADIECEKLNAWGFYRCENKEVVCYTNDSGLSCKWK